MKFTWSIFFLHAVLVLIVIIALLIFANRETNTPRPSQYVDHHAADPYFEDAEDSEADFSLESLPRGSLLVFKRDFEFKGFQTWFFSDDKRLIVRFFSGLPRKFRVPPGTELKINSAIGSSTLPDFSQVDSNVHSIIGCSLSNIPIDIVITAGEDLGAIQHQGRVVYTGTLRRPTYADIKDFFEVVHPDE